MKITLKTLPLSTNRLYRGRRFLTKEGKANKEAIAWEAKMQWKERTATEHIRLAVNLFWPDKYRRDVDNIKGLLDSLTGIIYEDDSQIQELRIKKQIDKDNPRVEITLF